MIGVASLIFVLLSSQQMAIKNGGYSAAVLLDALSPDCPKLSAVVPKDGDDYFHDVNYKKDWSFKLPHFSKAGRFPFYVTVKIGSSEEGREVFLGGTILHNNTILTHKKLFHQPYEFDSTSCVVVAGTDVFNYTEFNRMATPSTPSVQRSACYSVNNFGSSLRGISTGMEDETLLVLTDPFNYTDTVKPVCLWNDPTSPLVTKCDHPSADDGKLLSCDLGEKQVNRSVAIVGFGNFVPLVVYNITLNFGENSTLSQEIFAICLEAQDSVPSPEADKSPPPETLASCDIVNTDDNYKPLQPDRKRNILVGLIRSHSTGGLLSKVGIIRRKSSISHSALYLASIEIRMSAENFVNLGDALKTANFLKHGYDDVNVVTYKVEAKKWFPSSKDNDHVFIFDVKPEFREAGSADPNLNTLSTHLIESRSSKLQSSAICGSGYCYKPYARDFWKFPITFGAPWLVNRRNTWYQIGLTSMLTRQGRLDPTVELSPYDITDYIDQKDLDNCNYYVVSPLRLDRSDTIEILKSYDPSKADSIFAP